MTSLLSNFFLGAQASRLRFGGLGGPPPSFASPPPPPSPSGRGAPVRLPCPAPVLPLSRVFRHPTRSTPQPPALK